MRRCLASIKNKMSGMGIAGNVMIAVATDYQPTALVAAEVIVEVLPEEGISAKITSLENPECDFLFSFLLVDSESATGDFSRLKEAFSLSGEPRDGFIIKRETDSIILAATNYRSMIYAAYRFEECLRMDDESDLDICEISFFKERWMCPTIHGRSDSEDNFRYLARLGVNTSYLQHRRDAMKECKHLRHYVADEKYLPQISEASPPDSDIVSMTSGAYNLSEKYGMEKVMFVDEPTAIKGARSVSDETEELLQFGLVEKLPADSLGKPHCQRYRYDGWYALDIFHPAVGGHYREMMRQTLKLFPKLKTLFVYNEDAGAANCVSEDGDSPRYPARAHAYEANLLQRAAREVSPSFRVATGYCTGSSLMTCRMK